MMLSINPKIVDAPPDIGFFEAEEREGFFVSSMMKRYWAAQLKVLSDVARVCKKHNIRWFADCGTLLGAVRHGGYIPWDDDLDICMLRHDWLRFFEVAKAELPKEYCVINLDLEKDFDLLLGRVVNSHAIELDSGHLKEFFGCPYSVGIDIFPLDGLFDDEEKEESRRSLASDVKKAYDLVGSGKLDTPECKNLLSDIEKRSHTTLHRNSGLYRELLLLTEKLYRMCPSDKATHIALMPFWVSHHDHRYSCGMFRDTILLPFEYIDIPVPAKYNEVLKIEYGEYMTIHKGGGVHEYPVYKDQEAILRKTNNANPFRFTLTKGALNSFHREKTGKEKCLEMTGTLLKAHEEVRDLSLAGNSDAALQVLNGCQALAISLGTQMEKNMPGSEALVHMLEDYCEKVYVASTSWDENSAGSLSTSIGNVETEIENYFSTKKKEVLFLPCKASWWKSMEPVYRKYKGLADCEVIVMPLSYLTGDRLTGVNGGRQNDAAQLPDYINPVTPNDYDIVSRHPDIIITQYPYDDWGQTVDVPEFFYSKNLTAYTDELIYVPCFDVDPPIDENDKAAAAIKVMIEQPAVLYCDKVIVHSEAMKKLYVDTLFEKTGERDYWDKKLIVWDEKKASPKKTDPPKNSAFPKEWQDKVGNCKVLLFGINAAFLLENGNAAIEKLKIAMLEITEHSDDLLCIFSPSTDINSISDIAPGLWHAYTEFSASIKEKENVIYDEDQSAEKYISSISGYYGTAGVLAHRCRNIGKPVMLMAIV